MVGTGAGVTRGSGKWRPRGDEDCGGGQRPAGGKVWGPVGYVGGGTPGVDPRSYPRGENGNA